MSKENINSEESKQGFKQGDYCIVIGGTHKGKEGEVGDLNISKTGHLTVTITQSDGIRFKTLGKNIQLKS